MTPISSEMERLYWSQKVWYLCVQTDGGWNIFVLSGTCQYITVSQNPGENWWPQYLTSDWVFKPEALYMTNCTSVQVHVFQQQQPHTHPNFAPVHTDLQTTVCLSDKSAPTAGLVSWRLACLVNECTHNRQTCLSLSFMAVPHLVDTKLFQPPFPVTWEVLCLLDVIYCNSLPFSRY